MKGPTPVSRRVDVRHAAVVKIIAESLSQHDEKHVVPTPLSGIMVGGRSGQFESLGDTGTPIYYFFTFRFYFSGVNCGRCACVSIQLVREHLRAGYKQYGLL
jgi:hypothetical protein